MAKEGKTANMSSGQTRSQYLWPAYEIPPSQRKPANVRTGKPAATPQTKGGAHPCPQEKSTPAPSAPAPTVPEVHKENSPTPMSAESAAVPPRLTNTVATSDGSRKKPMIASKPPPKPERPRLRGSLSDQLANISAQSEKMIAGLKQAVSKDGGEMGTPKLLVYCNHMIVGRAESQFSAAVSFYNDKVVYAFQHARERRIDMIMYYKDMRAVSTDDRKTTLSFRIAKPLEHFSKDYDHTDAAHILAIPFSKSDFASFKAKVLPLIQAAAT